MNATNRTVLGPGHLRRIRGTGSMDHFLHNPDARPADPAGWWRTLCWVTERVAVSGDLDRARIAAQVAEWVAAGITDIVDVRGEANDSRIVGELAPGIRYHWIGTNDDGNGQSDDWFEAVAQAVGGALEDPDRRVVVHCHLGANRGPSAAYAALVAQGGHPIEVLDLIRSARPVASMMYAGHAVVWWARREGLAADEVVEWHDRVWEWHAANPIDVPYCIEQMGRRRHAA